jgi:hypothetical protein
MWEAKGGVNAPDLAHHIQFMRDKFQGRQSPAARGDHVPAHGSATRPVPISATWSPLAPHPGKTKNYFARDLKTHYNSQQENKEVQQTNLQAVVSTN